MLQRIYRDEIRHVAAGTKWFGVATKRKGISPENHYQNLVNCHFRGALKPPFNDSPRRQAGLTHEYYPPLERKDGVCKFASEIRPLPPVNELGPKGVPGRRRKRRGLHDFQREERWPTRLFTPFPE